MNPEFLTAEIRLINSKVKFSCHSRDNHPVTVDYIPPIGDGEGYTSLELLLISLSTCIGTSVAATLRKMQKSLNSLSIVSRGFRKEEHPTGFRLIEIDIHLESCDLDNHDAEKALQLAEKICPVWSMVRGNVEIKAAWVIHESSEAVL